MYVIIRTRRGVTVRRSETARQLKNDAKRSDAAMTSVVSTRLVTAEVVRARTYLEKVEKGAAR